MKQQTRARLNAPPVKKDHLVAAPMKPHFHIAVTCLKWGRFCGTIFTLVGDNLSTLI
jgi:hypothetical protein